MTRETKAERVSVGSQDDGVEQFVSRKRRSVICRGNEALDWRPDLDLNQDKRPCTAPASVSAIEPLSGS